MSSVIERKRNATEIEPSVTETKPSVTVRRQGGAAIMTIPSDIMRRMNLEIGAAVEVDVVDGVLTAKPKAAQRRKRYTLAELLKGVTQEKMDALLEQTKGALDGDPIGREL